MTLILFLLFAALILKQILFWVYLWQLKGYRYDRFRAEYGTSAMIGRFWIFSGGRKFWLPRWTAKAILITGASIIMALILLLCSALVTPTFETFFVYGLGIYFVFPLLIAFVVFVFNIPTTLIKGTLYSRAGSKIDGMKNLTVIGITGSYGKSSTKEFLYRLLSRKFRVQKTPENINSEIGIAQFVNHSLNPDTDIFIVEMGAYRIGEIEKSCRIVKPKLAILTGLNEQHMALFGSLENTKQAKFELIKSLPANGFAAFNGENKYCVELAAKWAGAKVIYHESDLKSGHSLPHHYRVNIAGAVAVAHRLGMSAAEIEEGVKDIEKNPIEGNVIKRVAGRDGALIIEDTYSANPDGVIAALDYLALQKKKTNIMVMPGIIELGDAGHEVHQKIGAKIAEVCDLAIITTPDYFKDIRATAGEKAILVVNSRAIIQILKGELGNDTAILLEGKTSDAVVKYLKS